MRISFFPCLIGFAISGCSSTVELSSAVDANRKIGDGAAIVFLRSGQEFEGREVLVMTDSTRFVDEETDALLTFPTRDIRSLQIAHHGGGAVEGLLFGGLGGGALGLALAAGMGTGGDEGMGRGFAILSGLVVGGVGGLVYGAVKGHEYMFVFPEDSRVVSCWKVWR